MKGEEYWHGTIKNYRYDGDVSPFLADFSVAIIFRRIGFRTVKGFR